LFFFAAAKCHNKEARCLAAGYEWLETAKGLRDEEGLAFEPLAFNLWLSTFGFQL
jgi:hypothetical protein